MSFSVQAAYKSFSKDKSHIHSTYCKRKRSIFFQIYDELLQLCFNDLEEDIAVCLLARSYSEAVLRKHSVLRTDEL